MYYSSKNNKTYQIGEWERGEGLYVHDKTDKPSRTQDQSWDKQENKLDLIFQNDSIDAVTLVVVTKEEMPYVIHNKSKTGNEAYDGFCIDLLKVSVFKSPNFFHDNNYIYDDTLYVTIIFIILLLSS